MIPVAGLIRVSTEAQAADDRAGIPRQKRSIETAVERHGLKLVKVFTLEGVSGSVVGHTPQWAEIRRLMERGQIKGVAVDAVDRLCRASELDLSVLADIQRHGGTIYTPGEVRSLSTSSDGLITGILALLAGQEKREIARRANAGKEEKMRRGLWMGDPNRLPPGLRFDKPSGEWSAIEPQIDEMIEIYRRIGAREISTNALANELGLSRKTLRDRLESPLYRGWLVCDVKSTRDPITGKVNRVKRHPDDVIKVRIFDEPPIPAALTDAVDARLASNRRVYNSKERLRGPDVHHFRGLLVCAECKGMISTQRRKRGHTYACRAKTCRVGEMQLADVHDSVVGAMIDRMAMPGWIETAMLEAVQTMRGERDDPKPKIRARLAALTERRERLVDLFLSGLVGKDEVERRKPLLDKQIEKAEAELAMLDAQPNSWMDALFERLHGLVDVVRQATERLPFGDLDPGTDVEDQLAQLEEEEAERAKILAELLKHLGGMVVVFREPGHRQTVEVRALRLDPRRLVELMDRLHRNGSEP